MKKVLYVITFPPMKAGNNNIPKNRVKSNLMNLKKQFKLSQLKIFLSDSTKSQKQILGSTINIMNIALSDLRSEMIAMTLSKS